MLYELLSNYELLDQFSIYKATYCSENDLTVYHSKEYIDFLASYASLPEKDKS
jgi:acetoin utilization deacetylase AcuC-like enzyme